MPLNLFLAIMIGLAGFFVGLRHIMSSPARSAFPQCPPAIRFMMFAKACTYAMLGSLLWVQHGAVVINSKSVALAFAGASVVIALYEAVTFLSYLNILPARFKRRGFRDFHVHTDPGLEHGSVIVFPESEKVLSVRRRVG